MAPDTGLGAVDVTAAKSLPPAKRALAQRELDRAQGDRRVAAMQLLAEGWTTADVALGVGRSWPWVDRLTKGRAAEARRYVRCACGWSASRAGADPTSRPCPRCGRKPNLGKRKARTIAGGRVRVSALVAAETAAALEASGGKSTQAARVLDSWAAAKRRSP